MAWMNWKSWGPNEEEIAMKKSMLAVAVTIAMFLAFGQGAANADPVLSLNPNLQNFVPPTILPGQIQPNPLPQPPQTIDPTEPWTKEVVLSKHVDDYPITIKLSEDKTKHQVILYGKLTVPFEKLSKGTDLPAILAAYCNKVHPVPNDNTQCIARLGNTNIFPWLVFPAAPLMNRIVEQAECEAVGEAGFFRCALPEATLEQFKLTGTTADEVAKEWKVALSDTLLGMGFRTMMFSAAIRDEADKLVSELSPLISTASAIVLSDRDADSDGVPDAVDNCKYVANYDQVIPAGAVCDQPASSLDSELESGETVTSSLAADKGGFCSFVPGASVNPLGLLMFLPALAIPLARRKRK